jgi:hypothetical protein
MGRKNASISRKEQREILIYVVIGARIIIDAQTTHPKSQARASVNLICAGVSLLHRQPAIRVRPIMRKAANGSG